MGKVRFTGSCLNGGDSVVEVEDRKEFGLYLHEDCAAPVKILYNIDSIDISNHSVSVGTQKKLYVVEHLFSALFGLNLHGVRIDVYGNEMPFFDGSSQDFARSLETLACERGRILRSTQPVKVVAENGSISYSPLKTDDLMIDMSLTHPHIGAQNVVLKIDRDTYRREIAPARTFVFTDDDDRRLRKLPPYGMGITCNKVYSASPLRFPDEAVRHKLLDLLGDLYVLRGKLGGKIVATNTSHRLNTMFASELLKNVQDINEN